MSKIKPPACARWPQELLDTRRCRNCPEFGIHFEGAKTLVYAVFEQAARDLMATKDDRPENRYNRETAREFLLANVQSSRIRKLIQKRDSTL